MNVDLTTAEIRYLDQRMADRAGILRGLLKGGIRGADQATVDEVGQELRRIETIRAQLEAGLRPGR